jgi:3-oxoacyl-[acyl-carrier protein] reductase
MDFANALDFSHKTVLVTGGSEGIGYGIAQAFRQLGAAVTVTGTRDAAQYGSDFSGLHFVQLDVADPASVTALAARFPELDVLVNCVGITVYKSREFERETFARVVDVNLTGVMHVCTELRDALAARRGCIVNLDSVATETAFRNNPAYSASKIGLKHLDRVLAQKWGRLGIRVNGIGPGMVPTRMTANQVNPEAEEQFRRLVPAGRYGTPEDMAGAVLFLASPLAAYVTGQSLVVDGGLTLISAL